MKVILEKCSVHGVEVVRTLIEKRILELKYRIHQVNDDINSLDGPDKDFLMRVREDHSKELYELDIIFHQL